MWRSCAQTTTMETNLGTKFHLKHTITFISMEPPIVQSSSLPKGGKRNPAADPRKMRRVIAEDPEWNLETIAPLVDVCIRHIIENFHERPLLDELSPRQRQQVLDKLPTSVPLKVTGPLISEEGYWEKCCRGRWELCDVSEHGMSWKRMFFERNAQEAIESFVPEQSNLKQLEELLQLSGPFVRRLLIRQLLPPPREKALPVGEGEEEEGEGASEESPLKVCNDHLDCSIILKSLHRLEELHLSFRVRKCGMNFEWGLFEFTREDCQRLAGAVRATPTLRVLRVTQSKAGDDRGRLLTSHLLTHTSLTTLDLSHNRLGDGTGRALGKLLHSQTSPLSSLDLSDNLIGQGGGASLGHALQTNSTLRELNLRMNRLGDSGAQPILKALLKNCTLTSLNLSSNDIGEPSAPALSEMLVVNKTLTSLSVSCNKFGEAGGRLIQEGMEENTSLVTFDLRMTEVSQESEYCINQIVKGNQDRDKRA